MSPDAGTEVTNTVVQVVLPTPDTSAFFTRVAEAIGDRSWGVLVALAIVGLVFAVRKKWPNFIQKGKWAWLFTVVFSMAGTFAAALAGGAVTGVKDATAALLSGMFLGFSAAGIFKGAKEWRDDK